jgi:hypothetical protein
MNSKHVVEEAFEEAKKDQYADLLFELDNGKVLNVLINGETALVAYLSFNDDNLNLIAHNTQSESAPKNLLISE